METVAIITTQHSVNDMRVTHRIAKTFSEAGYGVTWVGPYDVYNSQTIYGIDFIYLKRKNRIARFFELILVLKKLKKFDLYWSVDPDSAWISQYIAKEKNSISLFDIHERYHDDILRSRINNDTLYNILSNIFLKYMQFVISKTDVVVGVGETRLTPFEGLIKKEFVIKHYLPKSFSDLTIPKGLPEIGKVLIMHGKAAKSRGTDQVVSCLEKLVDLNVSNVEFQFFKLTGIQTSSNMDSLDRDLEKRNVSHLVKMRSAVSFMEMTVILKKCHIGIIAYKRDLGVNAMPNRFFEYIAFGMPVIFPEYSLELLNIHKVFDIGIPVDMENPDSICDAIIFLMNNPDEYSRLSKNCLEAFKSLNFENEFSPFINWLQQNIKIN